MQSLTTKKTNAVFGFCIRSEINECHNCVSAQWTTTEIDDQVKEWFPLKKGNIMVKLQDHGGVDDSGFSKKICSQPCQLGSFKISHSKRLMNDVILATDGFKNNEFYYGDTDSICNQKNDYDVLKTKYLVGKELFQSKNNYGGTGIIYGLFLGPKVKYCILNNEMGILPKRFFRLRKRANSS